MKNLKPLYQHLGYLFYSVAAADKNVTTEEVNTLLNVVKQKWLEWEGSEDEYGTDAAYHIDIVFDYLNETTPTAEDAFTSFEIYYTDHETLFTHELKTKIMNTARAIAHSFSGINKSELNKLAQLTLLFNK